MSINFNFKTNLKLRGDKRMSSIAINDLELSADLDKKALAGVTGGRGGGYRRYCGSYGYRPRRPWYGHCCHHHHHHHKGHYRQRKQQQYEAQKKGQIIAPV